MLNESFNVEKKTVQKTPGKKNKKVSYMLE